MTEARAHVLAALAGGGAISIEQLRDLSRTAYRAARAAWLTVAEPDPEP
jgi:phage-related minor tail protein